MKINRQARNVVIDDGWGAHLGLGVLVPAILVGVGFVLIWPRADDHMRFEIGALMLAATALSLAVLNPPRAAEFDLQRREVRLTIGWPPFLGRRKVIPFDSIREVKVSQLLHLGDDLGSARPAIILKNGEKLFLSTYKRSPKRCREIIEQVRPLIGVDSTRAST